jgi:hypothetical protein
MQHVILPMTRVVKNVEEFSIPRDLLFLCPLDFLHLVESGEPSCVLPSFCKTLGRRRFLVCVILNLRGGFSEFDLAGAAWDLGGIIKDMVDGTIGEPET